MKRYFLALLAAASAPFSDAASLPLSQLDLGRANEMYYGPAPKVSAGNHPIKIAGRKFDDGFGVWGSTSLRVSLDGQAKELTAWIGMTDDTKESGPVWFEVIGDGRMLWASDPMRKGEAARPLRVSLAGGVRDLILAVQSPGPSPARVLRLRGREGGDAPMTVLPPSPWIRPGDHPAILTLPRPGPSPRLTGAARVGARPGHPFLFTVSATGERPLTFAATGLPAGLSLDAATGQITGTVAKEGEYRVRVTARNQRGAASRDLRIVIGDALSLDSSDGLEQLELLRRHGHRGKRQSGGGGVRQRPA